MRGAAARAEGLQCAGMGRAWCWPVWGRYGAPAWAVPNVRTSIQLASVPNDRHHLSVSLSRFRTPFSHNPLNPETASESSTASVMSLSSDSYVRVLPGWTLGLPARLPAGGRRLGNRRGCTHTFGELSLTLKDHFRCRGEKVPRRLEPRLKSRNVIRSDRAVTFSV
eukprot:365865-Chlamydomonas_euryale.AAC.12